MPECDLPRRHPWEQSYWECSANSEIPLATLVETMRSATFATRIVLAPPSDFGMGTSRAGPGLQ